MGTMLSSLGEGLALTKAAGIETKLLLEVLTKAIGHPTPLLPPPHPLYPPHTHTSMAPYQVLDLGAMACPLFKLKGPKMLAADYAPAFPLKHACKDVRLAVGLGASLGLGLPIAAAADAAMARAIADGLGDSDFAAVCAPEPRLDAPYPSHGSVVSSR